MSDARPLPNEVLQDQADADCDTRALDREPREYRVPLSRGRTGAIVLPRDLEPSDYQMIRDWLSISEDAFVVEDGERDHQTSYTPLEIRLMKKIERMNEALAFVRSAGVFVHHYVDERGPFFSGEGVDNYLSIQTQEDERVGPDPTSDCDGTQPLWLGGSVDEEDRDMIARNLNLLELARRRVREIDEVS